MKEPMVVVVTGASAGVGRAIARAFAEEGAWVGLIARGEDGLRAAAREVEERGGRALVLPCDVADGACVEEAAARVEAEFGRIDVWVNNAMATVFAPVRQTSADEYRRVMDVICMGYVHGTKAALARMQAADRGVIIQVGSALAYRAIPLQSAYCAAKHAVEGFTESLRCELLHDGSGVQVCQVHLPAMNTPQFRWSLSRMPREAQPVPPIYQPEVAARAVVHVAHHPRRTFLVGAPTLTAVWGNKLFPGVGDRYLAARGYASQMTDEPRDRARPHNLYAPVPGDAGAHGVFDDRAQARSLQVWANRRKRPLLVAASAALALLFAWRRRRA